MSCVGGGGDVWILSRKVVLTGFFCHVCTHGVVHPQHEYVVELGAGQGRDVVLGGCMQIMVYHFT